MTAGLSTDAIALAIQVMAQSWAFGRSGLLMAEIDALARLSGLDSTRIRQAFDELSTRGLVTVDPSLAPGGPLTLRIPYLERQAARRQQQSESASRRRSDKDSTPQAQKPRSSEDQKSREKEKLSSTVDGAATMSEDAPTLLRPTAQRQEEPSLSLASKANPNDTAPSEADVRAVFAHYRTYHADAFRIPQRDSKEWGLIEARLREGRAVGELKLAIDGCHADPWHLGKNDWNKPHLDLSLILRDASKTSSFIGMARASNPTVRIGGDGPATDRLNPDKGWPKWWRACKREGIPETDALGEWLELRKRLSGKPDAEVLPEHLDDFVRRYFENRGPPQSRDASVSSS